MKRPALTTPGVIILQTLWIFLFLLINLLFSKAAGTLAGLAILLAFLGTFVARPRAASWGATIPPLATVVGLFLLLPIAGTSSFSLRLAIDVLNALAGLAPYLVLGAAAAWAFVAVQARRI